MIADTSSVLAMEILHTDYVGGELTLNYFHMSMRKSLHGFLNSFIEL